MKMKSTQEMSGKENPPGIVRKTLAYNNEIMLCHFSFSKGAQIPLHEHRASQIGYVISGKVQFRGEKEKDSFVAEAGDSYVLDPHKVHGAEALEDAELIETFYPPREEYKDF